MAKKSELKYYSSVAHKVSLWAKIIVVFGICCFVVPWVIGLIYNAFGEGWAWFTNNNDNGLLSNFIGGFAGVALAFIFENIFIKKLQLLNQYDILSTTLYIELNEIIKSDEKWGAWIDDRIENQLTKLNESIDPSEVLDKNSLIDSIKAGNYSKMRNEIEAVRQQREKENSDFQIIKMNSEVDVKFQSENNVTWSTGIWVEVPILMGILKTPSESVVFAGLPKLFLGVEKNILLHLKKIQKNIEYINEHNNSNHLRLVAFLTYKVLIDNLKEVIKVFSKAKKEAK